MTDYSTFRIEHHMAAIRSYIDTGIDASSQSVMGRTSSFWKVEFAARPNYPSVSDYLAFRREGFTHGMADGFSFDLKDTKAQSLAKEAAHAARTVEIFRQSADPARIAAIDESALGAPFVFQHHGAARSASFWTNAVTALRVKDIAEARGWKERPLNVLEIGAGWGCMAHQLHQLLPINTYGIVDLPQNLFLSSLYVAVNHGLNILFAQGAEQSVKTAPGSLLCALPGMVPCIGQKFDVVINSFSLQEMDLATVQSYLAWIGQALTENGVFISFNAHGKAGVRIPSDYPMEHFHLEQLRMFRAYPSGLLNTIPYEMVLSRRNGRQPVDPQLLNVLCCLIQFGLDQDLTDIFAAFASGDLVPALAQGLRDLSGYFSLTAANRADALERSSAALPAAVHAYLAGMHAFVARDKTAARRLLDKALDGGLRGFARLRACALLALVTGEKNLPKWTEDFDARMAYPELAQILDTSDSGQFIAQFERIVSANLV